MVKESKLKGFNINIDDVKPNVDIYEIAKYIKTVYSLNTLINLSWNNLEQICFINKKLEHPYCSFYFEICPKWGVCTR